MMLDEALWSRLSTAHIVASDLAVLRLYSQSKFNLFAALDRSTGHRFVIIKSDRTDIRPAEPMPAGRGFMVRFIVTASDREGTHSLQFELTNPAHTDVFNVIG